MRNLLLSYATFSSQDRDESTCRVHTEWRLPIFGVHPIMMEKSALAGKVGVASPLSTITYKVVVYAPAERADTLPLFHLCPICILWMRAALC
jgi:hypothetical protein